MAKKFTKVPLEELDNTKRDGPVLLDDPTLTRMQNTLRYMRVAPAYNPPNQWPEAMALIGEGKGELYGVKFMSLAEFEKKTEKEMFEGWPAEVERIIYVPSLQMPQNEVQMRAVASSLMSKPRVTLQAELAYLLTNRWYVKRPPPSN